MTLSIVQYILASSFRSFGKWLYADIITTFFCMFLQYDEDKANLKDVLKSAKAGLYAYRFFFCYSYCFPREVSVIICFLLYIISICVYLFQISVESSWKFEDFKTAIAESIDSLSISNINLQVQCLSSVIFTLFFRQ